MRQSTADYYESALSVEVSHNVLFQIRRKHLSAIFDSKDSARQQNSLVVVNDLANVMQSVFASKQRQMRFIAKHFLRKGRALLLANVWRVSDD